MFTGFQELLAEGEAFLEDADPEPVFLATSPGVPLTANVGAFKRSRVLHGTAFRVVKQGVVVLRRDVLAAAGITAAPQLDGRISIGTETFHIDGVTPDATSFTLDCTSV